MNDIELSAKSDRELLIQAVSKTNEINMDVKELKDSLQSIRKDHEKLKVKVYLLIGILAGTGVLGVGTGIWQLLA